MKASICVIVPCFNEESNVRSVIQSLNRESRDWTVLVINDCSKDATSEVARETGGAVVVDLPCNLGIGGGVQTGFKYARRQGFDIAVQFDGDGQHVASEIHKLIEPILAGDADAVIGSRFLDSRVDTFKSTPMRRVGINVFRWLNSLIIGQTITDNTSGFRAYNRKAIELLSDNYPADYPEPEAVILLGRNGYRICEIQVEMKERTGGVSSISGFRSAYYMIKVVTSVLIASIRPKI